MNSRKTFKKSGRGAPPTGEWHGPSESGNPHPHHEPPHHHHHHVPPHHRHGGGHQPTRGGFGGGQGGDGYSGRAAETLCKILPEEVINWLLRAVSYGPPEMVAIFKVQVAAVHELVTAIENNAAELPWFDAEDIQNGELTQTAMTNVLNSNGVRTCLENLFWGPEEVQSVAFLSLVVLRLTAASDADTTQAEAVEA